MPAGTVLVVGGWVFSPIIKELIGEVRSLLNSKYSSFKHLAKHLRQLVDVLEDMTTTVETVQQQGQRRRADDDVSAGGWTDNWVGRLVDAIHDVRSVLDDFTYDDIVKSNLRDNKVAQVAHSVARAGRRLIGRDKAFNRLKELLDELPLIQQSLRDLVNLKIHAGSSRGRGYSRSVSRRATGPLLPAAPGRELFVGYERDYGRLVSALLDVSDEPSSSSSNKFPRLQDVLILNCPRLAKLPRVPATVKKMRIEKDSSSYYLDMTFSPKSSSFTLDVHGEAVQLLHQDFLHRNQALAVSALSIRRYAEETDANLSLSRCEETDRQLGVFLENLRSLEILQISDCGEFHAFPEDAMPSSLKYIEVNGCHPTLAEKLRGSARICSIPRVHIC